MPVTSIISMKHLIILLALCLSVVCSAAGGPVIVSYPAKIEVRKLQSGVPYLSNRQYLLKKIPRELQTGFQFTVLPGGKNKDVIATVPNSTEVYVAFDSGRKTAARKGLKNFQKHLENQGWKNAGRITVSDDRMKYLQLYKKIFDKDEKVEFDGIGFPGMIVISQEIKIKK